MKVKTKVIKNLILSKMLGKYYKLNFAITSMCNSRCRTCNVWQEFAKNPHSTNNDLNLKEIGEIFKHLPKNFFWLSLSGGEPFLRNDIDQICSKAVEAIPSLCLVSIPSNGLLQDIIVEKTKKILQSPLPNLFLNFSIDGPEKIHNQIRGIPDAFKKSWSTYEKILALSRRDPRLSVNLETTISKYNIDYLEDFFKKITAEGHKITITLAHTGYLYKNLKKSKEFTEFGNGEKLKKIIDVIKHSLSLTSPVDLIERIYLTKISKYYKNRSRQPLPCTALQNSLALDQKGNITPCFMWEHFLGNIKDFDYDFEKFLKEYQQIILETSQLIKNQLCPNCWTPCEAYQSIIQKLISLR